MAYDDQEITKEEAFLQMMVALQTEADRPMAIVTVAMLEGVLTGALKGRLITKSALRDSLFGGTGPLATFSSKIDIGFCVGLYKKSCHHDLHVLRRVRNLFAHNFNPVQFDQPQVAKLCESMVTREENNLLEAEPRRVFLVSASIFMWVIAHVSDIPIVPVRNDPANLPPGFEHVPFL